MASSSGVWEPVKGRVPGMSAGPGVGVSAGPDAVLVTVKVALQIGGRVVNW